MAIDDIAKWIAGEWEVLSHAPISFLAAISVASLLIWKLVHREFATRLSNADSRLELSEARVRDYERQLAGATPDEARSQMESAQARIEALESQLSNLKPRRLTGDQKHKLLQLIPQEGGTINVGIIMGVADGYGLQRDFIEIFSQLGWKIVSSSIMSPLNTQFGLSVTLHEDTDQAKAAVAALQSVGLQFDFKATPAKQTVVSTTNSPAIKSLRNHDISVLICPVD